MSEYRLSTIWKFPLKDQYDQEIEVPTATNAIHVGLDPHGQLCMWAEVDPTKNKRKWKVWLIPTGGKIPSEDHVHRIGSFVDGLFVFHVYAKAII